LTQEEARWSDIVVEKASNLIPRLQRMERRRRKFMLGEIRGFK
jgi:hypothetical protein